MWDQAGRPRWVLVLPRPRPPRYIQCVTLEPQGNFVITQHQLHKRKSELFSLKKTSCDGSKRKIDSKWDHVLFRVCAAQGGRARTQ